MSTILLDLNYTLCANSAQRVKYASRYLEWLKIETYRTWLVEYCRSLSKEGHKVLLVTARPARWQEPTLAHIEATHGWLPDGWYFKDTEESPHAFKARIARGLLKDNHHPENYVGFESNKQTRKAYDALGILSERVPENESIGPLHPDPRIQVLRWKIDQASLDVVNSITRRGLLVREVQERKSQLGLPFHDADQAHHVVSRAVDYARDVCNYDTDTVRTVFEAITAGAKGIRDSIDC